MKVLSEFQKILMVAAVVKECMKRAERGCRMKKYLIIVTTVFAIISFILGNTLIMASGEENEKTLYRYYKNIEIHSGDSLWKIAEMYNNSDMDIREYIYEIKKINGMRSDDIRSGDSLIIVYFSDSPTIDPE